MRTLRGRLGILAYPAAIDIRAGFVVGVDVGGPRKGFHAVALSNGGYFAIYQGVYT